MLLLLHSPFCWWQLCLQIGQLTSKNIACIKYLHIPFIRQIHIVSQSNLSLFVCRFILLTLEAWSGLCTNVRTHITGMDRQMKRYSCSSNVSSLCRLFLIYRIRDDIMQIFEHYVFTIVSWMDRFSIAISIHNSINIMNVTIDFPFSFRRVPFFADFRNESQVLNIQMQIHHFLSHCNFYFFFPFFFFFLRSN